MLIAWQWDLPVAPGRVILREAEQSFAVGADTAIAFETHGPEAAAGLGFVPLPCDALERDIDLHVTILAQQAPACSAIRG
jgi:hypothetical protein